MIAFMFLKDKTYWPSACVFYCFVKLIKNFWRSYDVYNKQTKFSFFYVTGKSNIQCNSNPLNSVLLQSHIDIELVKGYKMALTIPWLWTFYVATLSICDSDWTDVTASSLCLFRASCSASLFWILLISANYLVRAANNIHHLSQVTAYIFRAATKYPPLVNSMLFFYFLLLAAFDLGTSSALSGGTDFSLSPTAPGSATVPGVGIDVSINNDDVVEQASTEQFMVSFTSDDVFPQMSADVTIFDDDSQGLLHWQHFFSFNQLFALRLIAFSTLPLH